MTARLAEIWRYPIKSHGRERLGRAVLEAGQALPGDRQWALALEGAEAAPGAWAPCTNFARTSRNPQIAPIRAERGAGDALTLRHDRLGEARFAMDDPEDQAALLAWVAPLRPEGQPAAARVMKLEGRGYTDSNFPSVTLCNRASHQAVEAQLGQKLSPLRWRGNLWVEGPEAWAERGWIGRDIRVGGARLRGVEHTDRCPATMANPETGVRDLPTVMALREGWGHKDFSIRCQVIEGGEITEGCAVCPA